MQDHQIPQAIQQVDGKTARFVAGFNDIVDKPEKPRLVLTSQGIHRIIQQPHVRDTQKRAGYLVGQAIGARTRQQLVKDGQGITRRTPASLDDHGVHGVIHVDVLRGHGALQQPLHRRRGQQTEGIVVGTRADGADDLLRLRRGEDEDDVLRRLLDNLEQGIRTGGRNHVGLIDDEDAVARLRRRVVGAVTQLAHILHTVVGGGVELRDVEVARTTRGQRDTRIAHTARR